jgi:hypothetical protein
MNRKGTCDFEDTDVAPQMISPVNEHSRLPHRELQTVGLKNKVDEATDLPKSEKQQLYNTLVKYRHQFSELDGKVKGVFNKGALKPYITNT